MIIEWFLSWSYIMVLKWYPSTKLIVDSSGESQPSRACLIQGLTSTSLLTMDMDRRYLHTVRLVYNNMFAVHYPRRTSLPSYNCGMHALLLPQTDLLPTLTMTMRGTAGIPDIISFIKKEEVDKIMSEINPATPHPECPHQRGPSCACHNISFQVDRVVFRPLSRVKYSQRTLRCCQNGKQLIARP
jgi:hypothetical protein